MPKRPPTGPKETQHDKFVKLARDSGADESEAAFVGKLKKIAPAKSRSTSEIGKKKPGGNK